jgi:hypothetical protein
MWSLLKNIFYFHLFTSLYFLFRKHFLTYLPNIHIASITPQVLWDHYYVK